MINATSTNNCSSQKAREILLSRPLALSAVAVGAILIGLGLVLRAYAGLSPVGMYCLIGTGALLAATFMIAQAVSYCKHHLSQPQTIEAAIMSKDLKSLEKFQSEINIKDKNGHTPLNLALFERPTTPGCDPIVKFLIDRGADANVRDDQKATPLFRALIHGHTVETIALLLDHGADVNATIGEQRTPLELAIERNEVSIVQLLIDRGADLLNRHCYICLALHLGKSDEICLALIDSGKIDLNVANAAGRTALEFAVQQDRLKVIEKLLAKGANPNIKTRNGNWLIHQVIAFKKIEALKLLMPHADLTVTNQDGKTAQSLAQELLK